MVELNKIMDAIVITMGASALACAAYTLATTPLPELGPVGGVLAVGGALVGIVVIASRVV